MKLFSYDFPVAVRRTYRRAPVQWIGTAAELARENDHDPDLMAGLRNLRAGALDYFYIGGGAAPMFCITLEAPAALERRDSETVD